MITIEDILDLEFLQVIKTGDFIDFVGTINEVTYDLSFNTKDSTILIMHNYRILYHGKPDNKQSLIRILSNL